MVTTTVRTEFVCSIKGCGVKTVIERTFDPDSSDTLGDLVEQSCTEAEDNDWEINTESGDCYCPLHPQVDEEDDEDDDAGFFGEADEDDDDLDD